MKKFILLLALFTLQPMQALAADHELPQIDTGQYELSGDTKLACEAILCLSSGTRPGECGPALSRYFGISKKKWKDTVRARRNFLNQCPTVGEDASMPTLVDAIVNGAGRCTAELLNRQLRQREVIRECIPDDTRRKIRHAAATNTSGLSTIPCLPTAGPTLAMSIPGKLALPMSGNGSTADIGLMSRGDCHDR